MSDNTFLSPGFMVIIAKNSGVRFPQLHNQNMRANAQRLALVDALNRGHQGDVDELIIAIAQRHNANPKSLKGFFGVLQMAGYISNSEPAKHFTGEPSNDSVAVSDDEVTIASPVGLLSQGGQYLWYDHQGTIRAKLSMPEVLAAATCARPITASAAWEQYREQDNADSLNEAQFEALLSRLTSAGLLATATPADHYEEPPYLGSVNRGKLQALVDARVKAHDEEAAKNDRDLVQVVPVNVGQGIAPSSLGMVIAYAIEFENGRLQEKYDFVPMYYTDEARIVERAKKGGIFLFSNYVWNVGTNLELSAAVKAANPAAVTIHGGPSTPKYEADAEEFFAVNPHVDITVRGEGEATFAGLLDALDLAAKHDLNTLLDVPGLSYRTANGVSRSPDRDRIADIDTIPSPILMGLFEEFGAVSAAFILETNRGCPYGCTFCDWGSATLSRVRRFDLDRVYKELEWCAQRGVEEPSFGDANFGMLERDVEITEKIAELKRTYGYPRTVNINYAKNQVRYLRKIIEILAAAGILAEGVASLQTTDVQTLKVVDRTNIKLEKYTELSTEFRRARLPLAADIMMGLPGSTPTAFATDLQRCTDRDIRARANPTQLLPNSPMNDPSYRKEHGIVARPGEFLKETSSYTREQWDEMNGLRTLYYLLECYGLLRYVARFVRREINIGEVAFYDKIRTDVLPHPEQWPVLTSTIGMLENYMGPLGSWALFVEEIHRYLVQHLNIADDSALRTTLAVQLAHMPAAGRRFPETLELEHDFAAWQSALFTAREEGHREDWQDHIPRLSEFGPATFTISDPNEICRRDVGKSKYMLDMNLRTWELESPMARPRLADMAS